MSKYVRLVFPAQHQLADMIEWIDMIGIVGLVNLAQSAGSPEW